MDKSTVNLGALEVGAINGGNVTVFNTASVASGVLVIVPSAGVTATGCSGTLPAGASCTLTITATPVTAGAFSGTVSITANPGAITPLVISVSAAVSDGVIFLVSPSAFDLGDVIAGVAAPKQAITITARIPLSDLAIRSTGASVSIDKTASTCTTTLAASASCVVVVNFLAATSGSKSDAIVISGGGANGKTVTIPITARVLAPAKLVISPSTPQAFVPGSTITFAVANSGDKPTGIVTAAVMGTNTANFSITNNTCLILASLAGCTISVVFNPGSVDAGAGRGASLVVTDTGTDGSSVAVDLIDPDQAPSALVISPSTTELGPALVGTTGAATVFTVVNEGGGPSGALKVGTSSIEFFVASDNCSGTVLGKGGSCTFSLALKPVTAGPPKTATLTVSDGGSTVERTVTGMGVPAIGLAADRIYVDFGKVPIGQVSPPVTITITNSWSTSTGPLSFLTTGPFPVFPIGSYTCSTPLSPNSACTWEVTFAPTAAQTESATITVTDGSSSFNGSVTVSLTGTGTR